MKFTESHEWIREQGGIAIIGVTQYGQKELGDVVYVELPEIGKHIKAGEEAAVLESTKAAADIYSPVSGTVVEVNQALVETSSLINRSPEKEGWIFKVKMSNPKELDVLLDKTGYEALVN